MTDPSAQATILVVDDNVAAAQMVSQIFSMRGYNTITVDNGQDAIMEAQAHIPDIILLDIMMPGMDGYEVLAELRKNAITAAIPVIFVTAKDDVADIEQGLGLGADDYIPKPLKPREVLARVRSKIEGRRLRAAIQKRTTELEALLRFGQELNTQLDVESLLDLILYLVLDLIACDVAMIYHLGDDGAIQQWRVQNRAQAPGYELNPEALFHSLSFNGKIELWTDTDRGQSGFPSGMAVQLAHGEDLHGILLVLSRDSFSTEDGRLFETIAGQTTLALRNAEILEHLEELVEKRTEELRSAEQLLVRSEKLASVGRLAAGIAHEINNPLMPIRMNLEMMQEDVENGAAVTPRDIDETLHSVNRISRIVERLQQFTRGRGEDIPELQPLVLSDVIESVLTLSATYIRHSGIKMTTDFAQDARIYGNPDQLEQVFLNIILNAQAAMENGGELRIETRVEGSNTSIRISDTGHGIEPENMDKIFEPFFSTKEAGSGLGLFISHNLIHNHSGRIEVESEVGKGTTFLITLPTLAEETS